MNTGRKPKKSHVGIDLVRLLASEGDRDKRARRVLSSNVELVLWTRPMEISDSQFVEMVKRGTC